MPEIDDKTMEASREPVGRDGTMQLDGKGNKIDKSELHKGPAPIATLTDERGHGTPIKARVPEYIHPEPDPADVERWLHEHADDDPVQPLEPSEEPATEVIEDEIAQSITHQ